VRQRDFPHADQNESDFSLGPWKFKMLNAGEMENHAEWQRKKNIDQAHAAEEELHVDS